MNGRRYLLSSLSPERTYIPVCQAIGEVCFPDLHSYAVSAKTPKPDLLKVLKQATEDSKRSYDAIKRRDSILTQSIPLMEQFANQKYG
jgi:hypothetical protein